MYYTNRNFEDYAFRIPTGIDQTIWPKIITHTCRQDGPGTQPAEITALTTKYVWIKPYNDKLPCTPQSNSSSAPYDIYHLLQLGSIYLHLFTHRSTDDEDDTDDEEKFYLHGYGYQKFTIESMPPSYVSSDGYRTTAPQRSQKRQNKRSKKPRKKQRSKRKNFNAKKR